jgi:uncharacterized protein
LPGRREHYRRYGHRSTLASVHDRFERIVACAGDRLTVFRAQRDGVLLGVLGLLEGGRELYSRIIGCRPDRNCTYFELTYYAPVRHAIAREIRAIHYGPLSLDAKRQRGCTVSPRQGWIAEVGETPRG